jgi:nitrogen-specific signal transduction histidine kinase/CheY-like chemotaxis protein
VFSPARERVAFLVEDVTERRRTEEQVRSSQRLEAIGRLAGGVAHDFNNLLSVILGYARFAVDGLRAGDPLRDDMEEVRRAAERAAGLTKQLLAFSRKQVLNPRVVSMNTVLREMEPMLRRLVGEDLELKSFLAADLGNVKADPSQLEQVLMNLVVNARDAMPDGGQLTIETANADLDAGYAARHAGTEPGPHVMLSVSDTGCGMDEATQARLFEPFFTTKEPGKGTGLGLSTAYGIVRQSGGSIWVYSEVGKGTTFKVYLPRVFAATDSSPVLSVPPEDSSETVLLVEDDDGVRALARRILSGAGFEVLCASNGGEALLCCERHAGEIHLLLTDVVMPLMSGRQLAERIEALRPGTKVLYMSGYTDDAIVHHGVLEPGTAFVSKPFSSGELVRKVREVLDASDAGTTT